MKLLSLNAGEIIFFRLMPDIDLYNATVVSADDNDILIRPDNDLQIGIAEGRYILIPDDENGDYYTRVTGLKENVVRLKKMWRERREYFRVDDAFPVNLRKTEDGPLQRKSRIFSGFISDISDVSDISDNSISPQLWKMLADINTKLELILEKLHIEREGLSNARNSQVNLSASGMKIAGVDNFRTGDDLEVRILLPTNPPKGLLVYGNVVRTRDAGDGRHEVALHFVDMDDEVREEIIQYTLKRQRDIIRMQKQQRGNDA